MLRLLGFLLPLLALAARPAAAYSVLTHQAQIDSCWRRTLRPALAARFPNASSEEWKEAKAHAYGGAIIQDMGYYPFGSHLFTNLTHYVRSGDFVRNLLAQARDRNEYAFALGALAHYSADIRGHREGINKVLPAMFPELKAEFGDQVTYEQAPTKHKQVEFAFDVVQLAAGRYRTEEYHDFIGFKVSKEALERAFQHTGLPTKAGEYPLADETYGEWLRELAKADFKQISPAVQQNILAYFGSAPKTPAAPEEKEADKRQQTQEALAKLRVLRLDEK